MIDAVTIYVAIADESVDVWRPVKAERLGDNTYRIVDQPYDREIETWEFEPGDVVMCELKDLHDGPTFVATRMAPA
jgi:hypothetical protein